MSNDDFSYEPPKTLDDGIKICAERFRLCMDLVAKLHPSDEEFVSAIAEQQYRLDGLVHSFDGYSFTGDSLDEKLRLFNNERGVLIMALDSLELKLNKTIEIIHGQLKIDVQIPTDVVESLVHSPSPALDNASEESKILQERAGSIERDINTIEQVSGTLWNKVNGIVARLLRSFAAGSKHQAGIKFISNELDSILGPLKDETPSLFIQIRNYVLLQFHTLLWHRGRRQRRQAQELENLPTWISSPNTAESRGASSSRRGSFSIRHLTRAILRAIPSASNREANLEIRSMLDYPKVPVSRNGQPLYCPICLSELEPGLSQKGWREHVDHDLMPYFCMSDDCTDAPLRCSNYTDWTQHLKDEHLSRSCRNFWLSPLHSPFVWVCVMCGPGNVDGIATDFDSVEQFRFHLICVHSEVWQRLPPNERVSLVSLAHVQPYKPDDECPICHIRAAQIEGPPPQLTSTIEPAKNSTNALWKTSRVLRTFSRKFWIRLRRERPESPKPILRQRHPRYEADLLTQHIGGHLKRLAFVALHGMVECLEDCSSRGLSSYHGAANDGPNELTED